MGWSPQVVPPRTCDRMFQRKHQPKYHEVCEKVKFAGNTFAKVKESEAGGKEAMLFVRLFSVMWIICSFSPDYPELRNADKPHVKAGSSARRSPNDDSKNQKDHRPTEGLREESYRGISAVLNDVNQLCEIKWEEYPSIPDIRILKQMQRTKKRTVEITKRMRRWNRSMQEDCRSNSKRCYMCPCEHLHRVRGTVQQERGRRSCGRSMEKWNARKKTMSLRSRLGM